jgi:glycosyltransferase involved in cell wall biosynthesis
LVIAGAPIYPESIPYYETHVLPRIDVDVSSQQKEFIKAVSSGSYNFKPGEVIYFGSASDDDKRALYPHARFMQFLGGFEKSGVLEGCPGTVLESLLSGTPVLGVSGSVTDELVEEGRTGFNLKKISDAVEGTDHLLSLDPMGTRDRGVRRFSTRIMTDNYIELYKKILES